MTLQYLDVRWPFAMSGYRQQTPEGDRLGRAFARWDRQAHRTLAGSPRLEDLVDMGTAQLSVFVAARGVVNAAVAAGYLDEHTAQSRLLPALESAQLAWHRPRLAVAGLAGNAGPASRGLAVASRELAAAALDLVSTPTAPASATEITGRVDVPRVLAQLQPMLAGAADMAVAWQAAVARSPGLRAPAVQLARRMRDVQASASGRFHGQAAALVLHGGPELRGYVFASGDESMLMLAQTHGEGVRWQGVPATHVQRLQTLDSAHRAVSETRDGPHITLARSAEQASAVAAVSLLGSRGRADVGIPHQLRSQLMVHAAGLTAPTRRLESAAHGLAPRPSAASGAARSAVSRPPVVSPDWPEGPAGPPMGR